MSSSVRNAQCCTLYPKNGQKTLLALGIPFPSREHMPRRPFLASCATPPLINPRLFHIFLFVIALFRKGKEEVKHSFILCHLERIFTPSIASVSNLNLVSLKK